MGERSVNWFPEALCLSASIREEKSNVPKKYSPQLVYLDRSSFTVHHARSITLSRSMFRFGGNLRDWVSVAFLLTCSYCSRRHSSSWSRRASNHLLMDVSPCSLP